MLGGRKSHEDFLQNSHFVIDIQAVLILIRGCNKNMDGAQPRYGTVQ